MGNYIERADTLPDSSNKSDFYQLLDGARVKALADADTDTKIQVEESSDEDKIRFDVAAAEQMLLQDGALLPSADDDLDLGSSVQEFKDLYLDGTANIDSLVADTADINGGTLDGVQIGGTIATGELIVNDSSDDADGLGSQGTSGQVLTSAGTGANPTWSATTLPSTTVSFSVLPSSEQTNIAIDSLVTIIWGTEVFDIGGNFATNTFTAPQTGKYQLNVYIVFAQMDTAATLYQIFLTTSNRSYEVRLDPRTFTQDGTIYMGFSVVADMDINDTAAVKVEQTGGAQQTDILTNSHFTGSLI